MVWLLIFDFGIYLSPAVPCCVLLFCLLQFCRCVDTGGWSCPVLLGMASVFFSVLLVQDLMSACSVRWTQIVA
jgi:hypothetical protein